jgi:hypothetical protein
MNTTIIRGSSPTSFTSSHPQRKTIAYSVGILAACTVTWICYSVWQNALKAKTVAMTEMKSPLPIIFIGMLGVAMIESIGLAYQIAKRILGEREMFESIKEDDADYLCVLDRCRYRTWTVIFWLENHTTKIDTLFSRIFRIRTEKELQENAVLERQLDFMEVVRIAFKSQSNEMLNEPYPARGYTILLLNFALGVSDKVNKMLHRIQTERIEERNRRWEENKAWCDILETFACQHEATQSTPKLEFTLNKDLLT